MTHFATADSRDKTYAREQLARCQSLLERLRARGGAPPMVHMANSGAILDIPESHFDACRSGIMLYGHYPSKETGRSIPLKQVMRLTTRIAHLRRLPAGKKTRIERPVAKRESPS